jgi:hypothetical protein
MRRWLTPLLVAFICSIPALIWFNQPTRPMSVLIVDKTVPLPGEREHLGLTWALNHFKIQQAGTARPFSPEEDYKGYHPQKDDDHKITPIKLNPNYYQWIYLTDTYGVYTNDVENDGEKGRRSKLIYGGVSSKEVSDIKQSLKKGGTLTAEFNCFATPTEGYPRREMEELLGLKWSGWVGRFFDNLDREGEIPEWLVKNYEKQYKKKYDFNGPGFAYVREDDRVIVLKEGVETGKNRMRLHFNDPAIARYNVHNDCEYGYWFDVVKPEKGTDVLANYQLDVTPEGEKVLKAEGLSKEFPAVFRRTEASAQKYYFAGDFADAPDVPPLYQYTGWDTFRKFFSISNSTAHMPFYWKVYVPLIKQIIAEIPTNLDKVNQASK